MTTITAAGIDAMIYLIRGKKVMLDADLANLYEVTTKRLNQQVRRNRIRFPDDFSFQLSEKEFLVLKSGNRTTSSHGGRRHPPVAFTEQGVAMLSSVLTSERAALVNISIMRTFVRLRAVLFQGSVSARLSALEKGTDKKFQIVFQRLDVLKKNVPILPDKRRRIGLGQD